MLEPDDVVTAAKAILLRHPGSDADIRSWIDQGFDRQTLQRAFLASKEFALQQNRQTIREWKGRALDGPAAQAETLSRFRVDAAANSPTRLGDVTAEQRRLFASLATIVEPRVIVVLGATHEEQIARIFAGADAPLVVISNSPRGFDLNPKVNRASPPILRLPLEPEALLDLLGQLRVVPDVVIVARGFEAAAVTAYERGHDRALVVLHRPDPSAPAFAALERVVPAHMGEVIAFGDVRLATHMTFPVPVTPRVEEAVPVEPPAATLALVAIVKDEEAVIEGMLRSAVGLADMIVLADTGSSDATCAVARSVCERIGVPLTIVPVAFRDFSQARNAALDAVPGFVDWVLMLDADESIVEADKPKLLDLVKRAGPDCWCLPRYNFLRPDLGGDLLAYPDRQARLFRRGPGTAIHFIHPVHETLAGYKWMASAPANLEAIGLGRGGPHIHHVGLLKAPAKRRERAAQYAALAPP